MLDTSVLFVITGTAGTQGLQCKPDTFYKLWKETLGTQASPRACPPCWGASCQHGGHMQEENLLFTLTENPFPSRSCCFSSTAGGNRGAARHWDAAGRRQRWGHSRWHSAGLGDTSKARPAPCPAPCQSTSCKVPQVPALCHSCLWQSRTTEGLLGSRHESEARQEPEPSDSLSQLCQIHVLSFHNRACFSA